MNAISIVDRRSRHRAMHHRPSSADKTDCGTRSNGHET